MWLNNSRVLKKLANIFYSLTERDSMPKTIHAKRQSDQKTDFNLLCLKLNREVHRHINKTLFQPVNGETLPEPIFAWTHNKRHAGTFWHSSAPGKGLWDIDGNNLFEIDMNPHYVLDDKSGQYFYRVNTHEFVHEWQAIYGSPGKSYHNSQFADKMETFGLICSHTGQEGGRRTGRTMTEYVTDGKFLECFEARTNKFKELFDQVSHLSGFGGSILKKKKNKIKYVCNGEDCDLTVWGKPGLSEGGKLFCFDCNQPLDEA